MMSLPPDELRQQMGGGEGYCRIDWNLNGFKGHGENFHEEDLARLRSWREVLNSKYGAGTHWVTYYCRSQRKGIGSRWVVE